MKDTVREPGAVTIGVVRSLAEFEALSGDWDTLPGAAADPLLSHAWLACAAAAFHADARLCVVTARRDGRLVGAAPLVEARRNGITWLEMIGARHLHEPTGILADTAECAAGLLRAVHAEGAPFVFQRIVCSPEVSAALDGGSPRGRMLRAGASGSPVVTIASDWDTYVGSLSSRRRYDYRRGRRRLEESGEIAIDVLTPTPETAPELLRIALEVEATSWKAEAGSAVLKRAAMGQFFSNLSQRLAARGTLRICFLRVGGQHVAMQLAAEHGERFWIFKIGYDPRWSKSSPGIQLMWDCLRYAFDRRLKAFEMLGSAEGWLDIWSVTQRPLGTFLYYPFNLQGAAALAMDVASHAGRKLKRRAGR